MLIPQILTPAEQNFMQQIWPQIRVAARLSDVNWAAHGLSNGPPLSPVSYAALSYVWPQIRVAAQFTDPQWSNHPVPDYILGAASPVPEAPSAPAPVIPAFVPADPVPLVPTYEPGPFVPGAPLEMPDESSPKETAPVKTASAFSLTSWPVMIGLTVLGFVLFGKPKFPALGGRRRRARR